MYLWALKTVLLGKYRAFFKQSSLHRHAALGVLVAPAGDCSTTLGNLYLFSHAFSFTYCTHWDCQVFLTRITNLFTWPSHFVHRVPNNLLLSLQNLR